MDNHDLYVGLDIGTTSIKVIVAELVAGQLNVIGVGSQRAAGVSRGVIVDIDKAAGAIRAAIAQAEEKASVQITTVVTGVPANMLRIEPVSGMVAVGNESKEIADADVQAVGAATVSRNLPPEREVLSLTPSEFIVDGFDDIKDPRGMIGVRLEMHGVLFTAPKTVLHNTKKAVEKAGLNLRTLVANPLAAAQVALNDGEQDFGTVLIDIGGGQSTAAVIHDHQLKFTTVDQEGGEYVTKDISVVLNTDLIEAEKLKRDYGNADSFVTSEDETFPVTVVGKNAPVMISEKYLAEIIEARMGQIFERLGKALTDAEAMDLPGGIVITGGATAIPGVVELAQDLFKRNVKRYVPDEMGLRHPAFTQALGLITFAAAMTDVEALVAHILPHSTLPPVPSHDPANYADEDAAAAGPAPVLRNPFSTAEDDPDETANEHRKGPLRRFFGNFFE